MNSIVCQAAAAILCLILWPLQTAHARASEWLEFAAGVAAMYAAHEGGHAAAAAITRTDIKWEIGDARTGLRWRENGVFDRAAATAVSSAGLASQAMMAEIILQSDCDKNSAFVRGAMAWNVLNPIQYALRYWLWKDTGDISAMEHRAGSRDANVFAAATAAMALDQGFRFLSTQQWAPQWAKSDRYTFSVLPANGDGLALGFKVVF